MCRLKEAKGVEESGTHFFDFFRFFRLVIRDGGIIVSAIKRSVFLRLHGAENGSRYHSGSRQISISKLKFQLNT